MLGCPSLTTVPGWVEVFWISRSMMPGCRHKKSLPPGYERWVLNALHGRQDRGRVLGWKPYVAPRDLLRFITSLRAMWSPGWCVHALNCSNGERTHTPREFFQFRTCGHLPAMTAGYNPTPFASQVSILVCLFPGTSGHTWRGKSPHMDFNWLYQYC